MHTGGARVIAPAAVAALIVAACAGGIALIAITSAAGEHHFMTVPAYWVSMTGGALVAGVIGLWLLRRGSVALGWHTLALAAAVSALFLCGAASSWFVGVLGLAGPGAALLTSAFGALRVPVLVLLFSLGVVAARPWFTVPRGWAVSYLLWSTFVALTMLLFHAQDTPFGVVPAVVDAPWVMSSIIVNAGLIQYQVWTLSLAAIPALLWWGAARTQKSGRRRMTAIAASGTIPLIVLGLAAALFLIAGRAVPGDIASAVTYVVVGVSVALVAAGMALAIRSDELAPELGVIRFTAGLAVTVFALLLVISVSVAVGIAIDPQATVLVAATAAALSAGLAPLVVRFVAWIAVIARDARADDRLVDTLSSREREVLGLLARGYSNAGIARELFLSKRTVDAHLRAIFAKLQLEPETDVNLRVHAANLWLNASPEAK